MADKIEFIKNYSDLSTNQGFQFEFFCDRCGSGFRTRFKPSVTGRVTGLLGAAGSIFGGIMNTAADMGKEYAQLPGKKHMTRLLKKPARNCARTLYSVLVASPGYAGKDAGTRIKVFARNAPLIWG